MGHIRPPHENVCKTTIAPFTDAHIERKSLKVDLKHYHPDLMTAVLSSPTFETFKAKVGFRTVAFRVVARSKMETHISRMFDSMRKVLEPTLP